MRRKNLAVYGFSLVEVVIAIGLISFVIVSLLGLGSVALNKTGDSRRDTLLANMFQGAIAEVKSGAWDTGATNSIYFDSEGGRVDQPAAFYRCQASVAVVPPSDVGLSTNDLRSMLLTLSWPATAPAQTVKMPFLISINER